VDEQTGDAAEQTSEDTHSGPGTEPTADATPDSGAVPRFGAVPESGARSGSRAKSGVGPDSDAGPEPDDDTPTVVVRAPHRRRGGVLLVRTLVALVSALALVATGIAWFTLQQFRANTNTTNALAAVNGGTDELGSDSASAPAPPPADDGATDILLVGSDSRTDAQGNELPTSVLTLLRTQWDAGVNTDTIMILRIPKNGGKAYAVSIPRDSYVSVPGIGDNKINAAYGLTKARKDTELSGSGLSQHDIEQQGAQAGQEALIATVQNLTGIRIDHYAEVNLYGFYLLSKAIGGVTVCLKHATSDKDSGADFRAGVQQVSGASALSFVRQRENLPDGDLSRIVRQQTFLASATRKMLSAGVLANPAAMSGLMDTVHKSLVTDPGLDLMTLIQQAQSLVNGDVEFVTIPVVNANARTPGGQSIVSVDVNQVHQFVAGLVGAPQAGTPSTPPPAPTGHPSTQQAPAVQPPNTTPVPVTTTTAPPAPPSTANAPTAPVTIDGVRCVD
jgi:LCP family protein required for cell wall assembly